jgi:hypothetical protein
VRQNLVLLRARDALVAARTELINTTRGLVKSLGTRLPKCSSRGFGHKVIDGHLNVKGAIPRLWLTFPRAYALNPLLWPLSFHLIQKVERLLLSNNAQRCDWKTYFEGRADAE